MRRTIPLMVHFVGSLIYWVSIFKILIWNCHSRRYCFVFLLGVDCVKTLEFPRWYGETICVLYWRTASCGRNKKHISLHRRLQISEWQIPTKVRLRLWSSFNTPSFNSQSRVHHSGSGLTGQMPHPCTVNGLLKTLMWCFTECSILALTSWRQSGILSKK